MTALRRNALLLISLLLVASWACNAQPAGQPSGGEPSGAGPEAKAGLEGGAPPAASPVPTLPAATPAPTLPATPVPWPTNPPQPEDPRETAKGVWQLVETTEALATGGGAPGMSVTRVDWGLVTSYTFPGNQGCPEQTFRTVHAWGGLAETLRPYDDLKVIVAVEYQLQGTAECAALTPGVATYLTLPDRTIETGIEEIALGLAPYDRASDFTYWLVPDCNPGDTMTIKGTAASGALGGSLFFKYLCQPRS